MRGDQIMQAGAALGPHGINLAIGEPVFLQRALDRLFRGLRPMEAQPCACGYPDPQGLPALRGELAGWEQSGCYGVPEDRIVIANGATQALAAAVYACRGYAGDISPDFADISHNFLVGHAPGPYYPGFPHIAGLGGGYFVRQSPECTLLAYPNNPTGCSDELKEWGQTHGRDAAGLVIWDAAYAHRQYCYDPRHEPKYHVGVGSAAKALGLSGTRVGWAWFPSREMARLATEYVERSSAGASSLSQAHVTAAVLTATLAPDLFDEAQVEACSDLRAAGDDFNEHLGPHVADVHGVPAGEGGMFAWFEAKAGDDAFAAACEVAQVLLVPGSAFGSPGHWRMNIGAHPCDVAAGCRRIAQALEAA